MDSHLPASLALLKLGKVTSSFWNSEATVLSVQSIPTIGSEEIYSTTQTHYSGHKVFTPGYTRTFATTTDVAFLAYRDDTTGEVTDRRIIEYSAPGDRISLVFCNGRLVGLVNRTKNVGRWWNLVTFEQTQTLVRFRDYFRPVLLVISLPLFWMIYNLPSNYRYLGFPSTPWVLYIISVIGAYFLTMALVNNLVFWLRKRSAIAHVKAVVEYVLAHD